MPYLFIAFAIACVAICNVAAAAPTGIQPEGPLSKWVIAGPFANPPADAAKSTRGGFDVDYLKDIGGEAGAKLTLDSKIADPSGSQVQTREALTENPQGIVDLKAIFPDSDNKLAYAYAQVQSDKAQEATFYFGSDDGAKVWVNGKLAFEVFPEGGRALTARQDKFKVKLKAGPNPVLVKVVNGTGDWKLSLEVFGAIKAREIEAEQARVQRIRDFQSQGLSLAGANQSYVFNAFWNGIPRIIWRDADTVRKLIGAAPLKVRWFNSDLEEVESPGTPGRYAALVESKMSDGTPIRRAITFYSAPQELDLFYADRVQPSYPGKPVDRKAFDQRAEVIKQSPYLLYSTHEQGAILMAALAEAKPLDRPAGVLDSPDVNNDDFQLKLKLKLLGREKQAKSLQPNKARKGDTLVLHDGSASEAGVAPDAKARIDAVCKQWAEESGEPFTLLVARNGVIVTHEPFGKTADGQPVTLDYRTDVMSITKAVTGILFSRFMDQGMLKLDDPIGKVLPGFPTTGPKALTYRHLFTHTSGLTGHGEFGGIHNPYLDNVISSGLEALKPGSVHIYNGMGYDLAGKAMELVSGKSIVRLFQEELFHPLGIGDANMLDLAYGAQLTSYQLGVLGQWLANRGDYGGRVSISEQTFDELLPKPLKQYWPDIDVEWGVGLTWFREQRPGATGPNPALILGPNVIGHGSASSCILRVDLDSGLVVAQIRRTAGPKYQEFYTQFLTTIADSLR